MLEARGVATYVASGDPNATAVHRLLESADGERVIPIWTDAIAIATERILWTRPPRALRAPVGRRRSAIDGIATKTGVLPALPDPYPTVCRDANDD